MSKSKTKATIIWSEQTEKLRQKFSMTDNNLFLAQGKMNELFTSIQKNAGKHELFEITTKL